MLDENHQHPHFCCLRRGKLLIIKIDEALARIEDGSCRFCEETGEPIGLPRLLARPTASLSIEAQELRERLQSVQTL